MEQYKILKYVGITFLSIGMIVLCVASFLFYLNYKPSDDIEITAVVSRIESQKKASGTRHTVYVDYTYNDIIYSDVRIGYYSSPMHEGSKVTIYISPDSPSSPYSKDGIFFGALICLILGLLFSIIGLGLTIYAVKANKEKTRLFTEGRRIMCTITEIVDAVIQNKGPKAMVIVCESPAAFDEKPRKFRSGNLYISPENFPPIGAPIYVYVDIKNPDKYLVDVSFLTSK